MNNMVAKLQQYKNLTFIWSEISFLNAWWEEAHPSKQRALRELVHSGRLEITTGGWVMTDEANVHLYAMVDQLIEGKDKCLYLQLYTFIIVVTRPQINYFLNFTVSN